MWGQHQPAKTSSQQVTSQHRKQQSLTLPIRKHSCGVCSIVSGGMPELFHTCPAPSELVTVPDPGTEHAQATMPRPAFPVHLQAMMLEGATLDMNNCQPLPSCYLSSACTSPSPCSTETKYRDEFHSQGAMYASQELSKLFTTISSALPGGDTTASGLGISILRLDNRQLLQPPALGQDWALGSTIPRYRCLPTENYAIAMDYGLFDKKLPVTIAMSGVGGDITGNLEDDLPLPVRTVPPRGHHHFLSGPS